MPFSTDNQLQVADLVDRPGTSRALDVEFAVPADVGTPLVSVEGPLAFSGVVESVVDGLLVRGRLSATLRMACARCLRPITEQASLDVVELFSQPGAAPTHDGDDELDPGYEILDGVVIDLDTLLRDALMPSAPYRPLCQSDCRGLCESCGADRNAVECACEDVVADPRWAPLAQLRLPDGPEAQS